MPNYYNGLIETTDATKIDCSKFGTISSVAVEADVPDGTSLHFAFKSDDGNFQKYDATSKTWTDISGDVTADGIAESGNTLAEVQAFTSIELAPFIGKTVDIAVALTMDESQKNVPTLKSVKFVGKPIAGARPTDVINDLNEKTFQDGTVVWKAEKRRAVVRQQNTFYKLNDSVYAEGAGAKYLLFCKRTGVTGIGELEIPSNARAGASVTDGTVTWTVGKTEAAVTAVESDGGLVTLTRLDGSKAQLQLVADNAGAHNAIYRGKDLTAYFDSGEMSKAIANGSFDNIFIGDYVDKPMTVNGTSIGTVRWRVADLDYFYLSGYGVVCSTHHVLMVPDDVLNVNIRMNATDTTEGAYLGSEMWKTTLPLYTAAIQAAFGSVHVLSHRELLSTSINASAPSAAGAGWTGSANNFGWYDVLANIMTEPMVYGGTVYSSSGYDVGNARKQLALFSLDNSAMIAGYRGNHADRRFYWLRAVASSTIFAALIHNGEATYYNASFQNTLSGIRPYFLLY